MIEYNLKGYKIIDNDKEPITSNDYFLISKIVSKNFTREMSIPILKNSFLDIHKIDGLSVSIFYLEDESQLLVKCHEKNKIKKLFENKTKLKLEEIN